MAFPSPACPHTGSAQPCGSSCLALLAIRKSSMAQEGQGKPCLAMGSVPPPRCTPASPTSHGEVLIFLRESWLSLATLRKCCTPMEQIAHPKGTMICPQEELCVPGVPGKALPSNGKCTSTVAHTCQTHPPVGSIPLPQIEPASPTHNWEVLHSCRARHPVLSTLGKSSVDEEHEGKPCPATGSALLL